MIIQSFALSGNRLTAPSFRHQSRARRSLVWLSSLAVLAGSLLTVTALDWPQWRGPNRDGISQESGWLTAWPAAGPKKVWSGKVGVGYSTVSVSNGRLYTMGNNADVDAVYCLDANTGAEIWKHTYACPAKDPNGYHGTRCTPTVDGKLVYTVSRAGHLFCLDAGSGKVVWSKEFAKDFGAQAPKWGFSGSPLVEGDRLIVEPGGPQAAVVALDKTTGKLLWQTPGDPAGYSSPMPYTADGQRCVAILNAKGVVGYRINDGKELWRHPWVTSYDVNAATPIIDGDKVFLSSGYNKGCLLLQFSSQPPKVLWQNKNMRNHVNSCILWQGYLYGIDDSELKCLDLKTGDVKWSESSPSKGSLTCAGGKFLVYSQTGRIAAAELSPAGYKELSGVQILQGRDTWAAPVLANGKLYCRSLEDLVCLDVTGK
jgi:outer membrane protein assembly factor BamB